MDVLNQVDLAFVIDTTGSMGSFIQPARQHMQAMLAALSTDPALPLDLRVGIVEYRDHPPQDSTFAACPHAFTNDLSAVQAIIDQLYPSGGGDYPESVYDGLVSACRDLAWREHSRRIIVLVGDAPPHNLTSRPEAKLALYGDCTCGLTLDETTATIEAAGISLYTLDLNGGPQIPFTALAQLCGGAYFRTDQGQQAIQVLKDLLANDFAELSFDREVLRLWKASSEPSIDQISEVLTAGPSRVVKSLSRLGRRCLLTHA